MIFRKNKVCDVPGLTKNVGFWSNFTVRSTLLVVLSMMIVGLFIAGVQGYLVGLSSFLTNIDVIYNVYVSLRDLSWMPLVIISLPLFGVLLSWLVEKHSCNRRDMLVILMTSFTILMSLFLYPNALEGGQTFNIPGVLGLGLSFRVDMLGFTMLMITSVLWFLVMVYAHEYMLKERHSSRFFVFMGITYSSVLGTIMAGDLLTVFLFFEVMTFASYMLVVHGQKDDSYHAGYNYIFMGIIGGFAILIAVMLLYFTVGDLSFASAIHALNEAGNIKFVIIGLLIFGFGIKAGMAPVHVWLPRAHPVAPTPASALLSGIMIKLGAYGILRVATSYYFPQEGADFSAPVWLTSNAVGSSVIWLGIITMTIGVFFALQQSNIKRMLAYHSISQMGYIMMGIGVALYLGSYGAMGYAGALYHIINHALFKSLLFMVAGVVIYHTGEANMYKLGGLWKKLPLSATVCLIAALGISGIPLFNGFVSKTILHHGIVEAYEYHGQMSMVFAERIFIVISAGTVASFIKLFYFVFLRKPDQPHQLNPEYNNLDTAMAMVALLIIFIGLNPNFILNAFIIPQLNMMPYSPTFVDTYIVGMSVFTYDDLTIMIWIVLLGGLIFYFGNKFHLFHIKLPYWLNLEYLVFYPVNVLIRKSCHLMYGDQCKYNAVTLQKLALKDNKDIGFLDRFVLMASIFNNRYEKRIIKSDAFIYTIFITGILTFMLVMRLL